METLQEKLKKLAKSFEDLKSVVKDEANTKLLFILPFIQDVLGYDIRNPREVELEYIAAPGQKKDEKVDIVLKKDGNIIVIIECKSWQENLNNHYSQLMKYYAFTKAKYAILTNGYTYRFYGDNVSTNVMDEKPFIDFDIDRPNTDSLEGLEKFRKDNFNINDIIEFSKIKMNETDIKNLIKLEIDNPSDEFIKYFASKSLGEGRRLTTNILSEYRPYVEKGIMDYINNLLLKITEENNKSSIEKVFGNKSVNTPVAEVAINSKSIETTEEEKYLFNVVKSIVGKVVKTSDLIANDTINYYAIQYANQRQTFLRFYSKNNKMSIILMWKDKTEKILQIQEIDDLYSYMDDICECVKSFKL